MAMLLWSKIITIFFFSKVEHANPWTVQMAELLHLDDSESCNCRQKAKISPIVLYRVKEPISAWFLQAYLVRQNWRTTLNGFTDLVITIFRSTSSALTSNYDESHGINCNYIYPWSPDHLHSIFTQYNAWYIIWKRCFRRYIVTKLILRKHL